MADSPPALSPTRIPFNCATSSAITISILLFHALLNHSIPTPFSLPPSLPLLNTHSSYLSLSSTHTISRHLRALTSAPHLSGTAASVPAAAYLLSHFQNLRLRTHLHTFRSPLSYPVASSLSLRFPNATVALLPTAEPGSDHHVVPPYHAYSPSGVAYAMPVFANYGSAEDYSELAGAGVEVRGCVAVVRRGGGGGVPRGAAVAMAAERGAVAVLMYTEGGGEFKDGVERGSVGKELGEEEGERMQRIPSMPVSEETAEMVLGTLGGGRMPEKWRKNGRREMGRGVGPGPTFINFSYQGENKWGRVRNVFAVIKGAEEPDRYILVGNHRDAWTYGAVDPNSGTSALLDIARRFSHLLAKGWRPRRTIILCSWDGEEFGMIGSTEWVGKNLMHLKSSAVAYLNVDCAVQGAGFFASATPQMDHLLIEVTKKVKDPDSNNITVYEKWVALNGGIHIQRLTGIDSDFAPFMQLAGVPALDLYFGKDYPVYHTIFDSYEWMVKYGDPLFQRHVTVAEIWGLVALRLADDPVLPFNYSSCVQLLSEYNGELKTRLEGNASLLVPLSHAIGELTLAVKEVEEMAKKLEGDEFRSTHLPLERRILNDRLMLAERGFLDDTKRGFKHLLYGPYGAHGSKAGVFPGISDALSGSVNGEENRLLFISREIRRVAEGVHRVASVLRGDPA